MYAIATLAPTTQHRSYVHIAEPQYSSNVYYEPIERNSTKQTALNCTGLRPLQATSGGGIYSCSNKNELHYISNKARNTVQLCTSNNNYYRNASNRVRIINSDTTVIHD